MKAITQYQAADGTIFGTPEAAERHERLAAECAAALAPLGKRPDGGAFGNGGGYVQHTPDAVRRVKRRLVALLDETMHETFGAGDVDAVNPFGLAGRIASEAPTPLARAWNRLGCIDEQGREWGQPFFALNPGKGEQREVAR